MSSSQVLSTRETSSMSRPICKSESRGVSRDTNIQRLRSDASSTGTLHEDNTFDFDGKTSFAATQTLANTRSANFALKQPKPDDDIWKRPAPDFRPQAYGPKPPKRNSREAMRPWRYNQPVPDQEERVATRSTVVLPQILHSKSAEEPMFRTHFDIMDPSDAKVHFVREGQFRPGSYHLPKPHDFRQYPSLRKLGLPEFDTSYDKDPFNIKFNTQRLRTIHGSLGKAPTERDTAGRQMAPPLPGQPGWEARLILPTESWPNKYHAYTRYRRPHRSPHSALMDRVEETLDARWAKQKLDLALSKQAQDAC